MQGLKTGYFPPATRVMPRVSREFQPVPTLSLTHSSDIEAECRDDFMKLRVAFNDSFSGLIYSAGEFGDVGGAISSQQSGHCHARWTVVTASGEEVACSVSFSTPFAYSCNGDCQSFYPCCFFLDLLLPSASPSPCFLARH